MFTQGLRRTRKRPQLERRIREWQGRHEQFMTHQIAYSYLLSTLRLTRYELLAGSLFSPAANLSRNCLSSCGFVRSTTSTPDAMFSLETITNPQPLSTTS